MDTKQERNWVVFCHLSGLITVFFLDLIIPLAIWLTKKSESPFIDEQGKEIVNFQISLTIYAIVIVLVGMTIVGMVVAIPAGIALYIVNVISVIRGAMKASIGEPFLYPINLRLVK